MGRNYNDDEAAEFYSDPEKRSITGKQPVRRSDQGLTTHVPIRFRPDTLSEIKGLAKKDGMTVSGWIRQVCEDEVERRWPDQLSTFSDAMEGEFSFRFSEGDHIRTATG